MKFFQTTVAVLAANIAALVTVLFVNLLISRTLGAEGKGLVSLYLNLAEVLYIVASLGLATAIQYFVSRNQGDVRVHLGNLLYVPLAAAAVLVAIFIATYSWWQSSLQNIPLGQIYPALMVLPLMIIFESLAQFLVAIKRVNERSIAVFLRGVLALVAVAMALLLPAADAITAMWAFLIAWTFASGLAVAYVVRAVGWPRLPALGLLKQTLKYGIWVHATNVARHAFQKVDFLLVFALLDSAAAGVYSVATGLTSALLMIPLAVQTVFFPKTAGQSQVEAESTTPMYYRQMAIFMTAGAVASALVARPVLSLFGPEFLAAQWPFTILLIGAILKGVNGILATHLLGRGYAYLITFVTVITFLCGALLNYLMIGEFKLMGAAVATTIGYVVQGLVLVILYSARTGGKVGPLFRFRFSDLKFAFNSSYDIVVGTLRRKANS